MTAPTEIQLEVLESFDGYRVVMQFTSGELVIAPRNNYRYAKVIDTEGQVYGYVEYMSTREHRRRSEHRTQPLKPCAYDTQT